MSEETKVHEIRESFLGDPGAIGTAGFAVTTMTLSLINAHIIPANQTFVFVPMAMVFGGLAQVLAGMWEIKKNNTLGAAVFTTYGFFWVGLALMLIWDVGKILPYGPLNGTLGWYLAMFFLPALYFWIASWKTNWVLNITLLLVVLLIVFGVIGNLGGSAGSGIVSAWCGVLSALGAFYLSAASCINSTFKRIILPVGPLS